MKPLLLLTLAAALCAQDRVEYPHSITPGGPPPAVQGQLSVGYQGQDSFLHVYPQHGDLYAWVNYRSGGSVFWTPHPVLIHAWELVLQDREGNLYRGRCENGISMTPPREFVPPPPDLESPPSVQFPVPPEIPPAPWEFSFAFDFPVTGGWPDVPYTPVSPPWECHPCTPPGDGTPVGPAPPLWWPGGWGYPTSGPVPPVRGVVTPEPGTWILMAMGILIGALLIWKERDK